MALFSAELYLSFLLVKILSIIHYSANGRVSIWGDLNEVEPDILCASERLISFDYAHLVILFVDETNLRSPDSAIYS